MAHHSFLVLVVFACLCSCLGSGFCWALNVDMVTLDCHPYVTGSGTGGMLVEMSRVVFPDANLTVVDHVHTTSWEQLKEAMSVLPTHIRRPRVLVTCLALSSDIQSVVEIAHPAAEEEITLLAEIPKRPEIPTTVARGTLCAVLWFWAAAHLFGILYWFIEGRYMDGHWFDNIITSVYYSFVVLCTVGYGDVTPQHRSTKILTVMWSFIGMILVTILTTTVFVMLSSTIVKDTSITDDKGFQGALVAVEADSGYEDRCQRLLGTCVEFPKNTPLSDQVDLIRNKTVRYVVVRVNDGVGVVKQSEGTDLELFLTQYTFTTVTYAFAATKGSGIADTISTSMLHQQAQMDAIRSRYTPDVRPLRLPTSSLIRPFAQDGVLYPAIILVCISVAFFFVVEVYFWNLKRQTNNSNNNDRRASSSSGGVTGMEMIEVSTMTRVAAAAPMLTLHTLLLRVCASLRELFAQAGLTLGTSIFLMSLKAAVELPTTTTTTTSRSGGSSGRNKKNKSL
eukprot:PhM_4_TR9785/c1_g1_i1/m.12342